MIGRECEMAKLEELFASNKFEFLVLYGQKRVGKSTLLANFAKKHNSLYFLAQEKNNALNIFEFTRQMQSFFLLNYNYR